MAAISSTRQISSFVKRVVTRISTPNSLVPAQSHASALIFRRSAHASVYDKNPDDQITSSVVPDYVIQPQSDNYWAPHPQTGVFGPASGFTPASGCEQPMNSVEDSVLEQKAWFRPTSLEDLEKPMSQI